MPTRTRDANQLSPVAGLARETRRGFLSLSATGLAGLAGCGGLSRIARAPGFPPEPWSLTPAEKRLLAAAREDFEVIIRSKRGKRAAGVLRALARPVPPGLDLSRVAARMERTMRRARGVGIAGPQVGLGLRVATLMLDYKTKKPYVLFVRNPVIVQRSDESMDGYEGCLSIPGVGGLVRRSRWIKVEYTDAAGRVQVKQAEGPNAVLWQHELDHLDGVLYVDRLLGQLLPMDEVRRRRKERDKKGQGGNAGHRSWDTGGWIVAQSSRDVLLL